MDDKLLILSDINIIFYININNLKINQLNSITDEEHTSIDISNSHILQSIILENGLKLLMITFNKNNCQCYIRKWCADNKKSLKYKQYKCQLIKCKYDNKNITATFTKCGQQTFITDTKTIYQINTKSAQILNKIPLILDYYGFGSRRVKILIRCNHKKTKKVVDGYLRNQKIKMISVLKQLLYRFVIFETIKYMNQIGYLQLVSL